MRNEYILMNNSFRMIKNEFDSNVHIYKCSLISLKKKNADYVNALLDPVRKLN